jgi:transposase-like protein
MAMRIRRAMIGQRELLEGIVEMDETCLGGKPRKRHGGGHKRGRGASKQPVVGMIERDGLVKAMPARNLDSKALSSLVREHVDVDNATMMTDEYSGYCKLAGLVPHKTVNHKVWYVAGDVHTNSIVSFWALLKGGLVGQFHKVSIRHLSKYIDEFCYRHNHRKDQTVFDGVIANGLGALQ